MIGAWIDELEVDSSDPRVKPYIFNIPDAMVDVDLLNSNIWSRFCTYQRGINDDHRDWVWVKVVKG